MSGRQAEVMAELPDADSDKPPRAVFRFPRVGVFAVVFAMILAAPFTFNGPVFALVYLVPLAVIYWIVRPQTAISADGLSVRTLFGKRDLTWDDVKGLALSKRSKVTAVLHDDTTVGLPAVLTRDLPLVAEVSGGRIGDPTASREEPDDQERGAGGEDDAE